MTLSTEQRRLLTGLAVFVFPLALVKLLALLSGAPSPAHGQEHSTAGASVVKVETAARAPAWSDRAVAAAQYAAGLRTQPFVESPMYYPGKPGKRDASDQAPPPIIDSPANPTFQSRVTLILGSPRGDVVMVDGRFLAVGEAVPGTTWIVQGIEASSRRVTFRHEPSGDLAVRTVQPR